MENIRRTLQIFTRLSQKYVNDNEDAIEDRSCYLYAIEALLDFGHLETGENTVDATPARRQRGRANVESCSIQVSI